MVRVAAFRMNFDRAYTLLERALGTMRDWGRLCAAALGRVWLHLKEARISEAAVAHERLERLAEKYHPSVDFAWSERRRYSALARTYLASAQQRFDDTISTLERLRDDAEQVQNHYFALRLATHLCIVRFSANQTTEALGELRRVLKVSAQARHSSNNFGRGPED
jgi:hypothetical protein